jgi:dTDP-glucose pyrophosphorylase
MMKRIKKIIKQGITEKAKRYELTEIVKEAMCQGVIMEQMYGSEQDTMEMIYDDDPLRLTEFILENIDNIRKDMEKFNKKSLH